jgi:hypothetical protein
MAKRWAAALLLARAAGAPQTPRTLLLSAALVPTASAGLFTAYHINVVNRTHAYVNTTHSEPWWRRRSEVEKPRKRRWWHLRRQPEPEPETWWDWFFAKPKEPPTHLPWWRGGGHDDSILRPPSYWAALEEKQRQERPWWRRKLQAEATKRSYGTDNYKGTTWGVAVGAQADQNYPIGGLRCYYTVKGGISGGWALAVDEPQINKAGNNQKAILCPEGQNKFCVRTEVVSLQNIECGWTEFYGDRPELTPADDVGCIFKKCASTCKEDKMTVYSNYLERYRETTPYNRDTLCCKTHYCNFGARVGPSFLLGLGVMLFT